MALNEQRDLKEIERLDLEPTDANKDARKRFVDVLYQTIGLEPLKLAKRWIEAKAQLEESKARAIAAEAEQRQANMEDKLAMAMAMAKASALALAEDTVLAETEIDELVQRLVKEESVSDAIARFQETLQKIQSKGGHVELVIDEPPNDQDLRGDDLKFVSYMLMFAKRDFEAILQPEQNEWVDYDTDGASFCALKVSQFMALLKDGRDIPAEWRNNAAGRPAPDDMYGFIPGAGTGGHGTYSKIPQDDHKYIHVAYSVRSRRSRDQNQDQHDAERRVADTKQRISDSSKE